MSAELPAAPPALPRPVTDAHTHLGTTTRKTGLSAAEQLDAARAVGVLRVVDVGYDVESSERALAAAEAHPEVIAAVAIHPHDAAELGDGLDEALRRIETLVGASERVRGVGETGLDHHWIKDAAGRARQKASFAAHIGFAKASGKVLVVHDRDAHDDLADVLDAEGWPERVQLHCFSGDAEFARRCLTAGAHLSFPGTITFKANEPLREALRLAPLDRILVETDAPYLTPMPHRGKPNASLLMPYTVRAIADIRGESLDAVCDALHANAAALFGAWGDDG